MITTSNRINLDLPTLTAMTLILQALNAVDTLMIFFFQLNNFLLITKGHLVSKYPNFVVKLTKKPMKFL